MKSCHVSLQIGVAISASAFDLFPEIKGLAAIVIKYEIGGVDNHKDGHIGLKVRIGKIGVMNIKRRKRKIAIDEILKTGNGVLGTFGKMFDE